MAHGVRLRSGRLANGHASVSKGSSLSYTSALSRGTNPFRTLPAQRRLPSLVIADDKAIEGIARRVAANHKRLCLVDLVLIKLAGLTADEAADENDEEAKRTQREMTGQEPLKMNGSFRLQTT
jgi:hypothetical protein